MRKRNEGNIVNDDPDTPPSLTSQNQPRRLLRNSIRDRLRMGRDVQWGDREVDDADVCGAVDSETGGDDAAVGAGEEGGGTDGMVSARVLVRGSSAR